MAVKELIVSLRCALDGWPVVATGHLLLPCKSTCVEGGAVIPPAHRAFQRMKASANAASGGGSWRRSMAEGALFLNKRLSDP